MKVTLETGRDLALQLRVKIKGVDDLWDFDLRQPKNFAVPKGHTVTVKIDQCLPGRRADEIEFFVLNYDGVESKIPPTTDGQGNLMPIKVMDGTKDYATNLLRQAALNPDYGVENGNDDGND